MIYVYRKNIFLLGGCTTHHKTLAAKEHSPATPACEDYESCSIKETEGMYMYFQRTCRII